VILDLFSSDMVSKNYITKFINEFAKDDNWHNIDKNNANIGYAFLHYALIRIFKPKNVLCIGSRYGFIPAICALACKDNNYGKVDFVDAGFDQNDPNQKNHWGGIGLWKTKKGKEKFKKFGLGKFIRLHVKTTQEFRKRFQKKQWQYIYIDGDHSYMGVKKDFNLFAKKIDKNTIVSFHDTNTKDLGGLDYGVGKFWNEIDNTKFNKFEFPGLCGLGIIQKR